MNKSRYIVKRLHHGQPSIWWDDNLLVRRAGES